MLSTLVQLGTGIGKVIKCIQKYNIGYISCLLPAEDLQL